MADKLTEGARSHYHGLRDIVRLYAKHPLREETILRRVKAGRSSAASEILSERDLAFDPRTEITDQNHVGGADFVDGLATAASVRETDLVYDLGCGLGGPARYLAMTRKCHVIGIDASLPRCEQAAHLTRLVKLDHLVSIQCADIEDFDALRKATVLWGQCSWVHLRDREGFFKRWISALSPGGRIAFEEPYLIRPPSNQEHARKLKHVMATWRASLVGFDLWQAALEASGSQVYIREDLGDAFRHFLIKLLPNYGEARYFPGEELEGWQSALELVEAGVIGYIRCVARI